MILKCTSSVFLLIKVLQEPSRMSLRKQVIKDVSDTRSGDQEEEDTRDDGDDNVKKCESAVISTDWGLCV